ncbi:MAG TPA: hypothetical protein VEX15_16900 [Nocardioidaceae bacterium]|nr:hypothetical protein [Nocardioidaceae bacterium]
MNQFTPPPDRDLPVHRHHRIRRALAHHVAPGSRPTHPFRAPLLAGGAVAGIAAVTLVGFSTWPGGPGDEAARPAPDGTFFAGPSTDGGTVPADPVAWCHGLLDASYLTPQEEPDDPDFEQWPLETGPSLRTPDGVVQILVDQEARWWWACDSTVGADQGLEANLYDGTTLPRSNDRWTYALSSANTGSEENPTRYVWGAGPVPAGVDAVRFTFPDGHVEDATVSDGFWMVRYQADTDFPDDAKIQVEAGGESFAAPWDRADCVFGPQPPGSDTPQPCTD